MIWWIDYIDSVSETELTASLERFKAISDRLVAITGATVDGWEAAQNALRNVFPGMTLAECHFHAMLKLGQHLATYKRQRKKTGRPISEAEEATIRGDVHRIRIGEETNVQDNSCLHVQRDRYPLLIEKKVERRMRM